jgi:hypothetical protein
MKEIVCQTRDEIINAQGMVINNPDGTISVYTINPSTQQLAPYQLTKACCDSLGIPGAYFDINTQKCRWTASNSGPCDYNLPFNIVLNPKGNDGAIFSVAAEETCTLSVDFDYLFKFDCETLTDLVNGAVTSSCNSVIDVFESVAASMSIGLVVITGNSTTLVNIFEEKFFNQIGTGNLYNYLATGNSQSGFFICGVLTTNSADTSCYPVDLYNLNYTGDTINCTIPINQLVSDLFTQSGLPISATTQFKTAISGNTFGPNWLHFHTDITDESVLSAITNEKIKLTLKVSGTCVDTCILVDNIRLSKNCTKVTRNDIFLTKSPGFELDRIRDNKKSWVANDTTEHRTFSITNTNDSKPIRTTDYLLENENQIINSKEIDLDISIASAIETDVWDYVVDNSCILTGVSVGVAYCIKEVGYFKPGEYFTGFTSTTITSTGACSALTSTTYSCPIGYTPSIDNSICTQTIVTGATPPSNPETTVAKVLNVYNTFGTLIYDLGYNLDGTGTFTQIPYSNPFWVNGAGYPTVIGDTVSGPLNRTGLWSTTTTSGQTLGFTVCVSLSASGIYYVGSSADNLTIIKVDGNTVLQMNPSAMGVYLAGNGYPTTTIDAPFRFWHIYPISLFAGDHIIEIVGQNEVAPPPNPAAVGIEIYSATSLQLQAATSYVDLGQQLVFSSKDYIGQNVQVGSEGFGYSCPSGYSLDICSTAYTCTRINTTAISGDSTIYYSGSCSIITGATPPDTVVYTSETGNVIFYTAETFVSGITVTASEETIICEERVYCCSDDCGDKPIDINSLLTQPLSSITTLEDFQYILSSQLIDAKNRKTISSYPTLRLVYDRYMNTLDYCSQKSSQFDYFTMDKFADLIGNYWVDIIEQVIPATTLWGSTRVYSNTMFDSQKFQYKSSSLFFGENAFHDLKVLSPATGVTCPNAVEVETSVVLGNLSGSTEFFNLGGNQKLPNVYVVQMNSGSEFLGNVTVVGTDGLPIGNNGTGIVINEII